MNFLKIHGTQSGWNVFIVLVMDITIYEAAFADACGTEDYYFVLLEHFWRLVKGGCGLVGYYIG